MPRESSCGADGRAGVERPVTDERDLRGGVPSVEQGVSWEMGVSVVHTDRVDLFFVTFDSVWRTNVISEEPGVGRLVVARHRVDGSASKQ